jgi:hypothetical protein
MQQRTVMAGVALGPSWNLGHVAFSTGPRVAGMWLQRSFTQPLYSERERYFSVAPGWMAAFSLAVHPRVMLMLQGQLLWAFVPLDEETRAVGMASVGLNAGYRF